MKSRTQKKHNSGFTLVEVLATVGILIILLSVSAVAIVRYVDALKITELDNAAREIFMAMENRAVLLSASDSMENIKSFGVPVELGYPHDDSEENLYYVDAEKIKDKLMTVGNIDPALLDGDFYIVFRLYEDDAGVLTGGGTVTDVIYAEKKGSLSGLLEGAADESAEFASLYNAWWSAVRSDRQKKDLLVGFYNGSASQGMLLMPVENRPVVAVTINNGEELTVKVEVTVTLATPAIQEEIEEGLEVWLGTASGTALNKDNSHDLLLDTDRRAAGTGGWSGNTYACTWVLDSLTDYFERETVGAGGNPVAEKINIRFHTITDSGVVPGDAFKVVAAFIPTANSSFKAASAYDTNNSLFAKESTENTAYIAYLRHLQNLDADGGYQSGVKNNSSITSAKQVAAIFGEGSPDRNGQSYYTDYRDYEFIPIKNPGLADYDGGSFEIQNLNLLAAPDAFVGLFSETRAAGMSLRNIRMVNTKMTAEAEVVGALAGKTSGASVITNCWVYWNERRLTAGTLTGENGVLANDEGIQYRLKGTIAGGLVGRVESGTMEITGSLAATLIQGSESTGGLVGQAYAGASSVTVTNSYADCYLHGSEATAKAAGLIGDLNTAAVLTNCYAAGFIEGSSANTAGGLCMGEAGATTATNVYSVMLRLAGSGVAQMKYLTGAAEALGDGSASSNVHFLGSGVVQGVSADPYTRMTMKKEDADRNFAVKMNGAVNGTVTDSFVWLEDAGKDTYAYEVRDQDLEGYAYPGLKDKDGGTAMPHYGDWGSLVSYPMGVAYYEQLGSASWRLWDDGNVNTLVNDQAILRDGYAVAVDADDLSGIGKIWVKYTYYKNGAEQAPITKGPYSTDGASGTEHLQMKMDGVGVAQGEGEDPIEADIYLIPLPDDLMENCTYTPDSFYWYLKVGLYRDVDPAGGADPDLIAECFINPHFAKAVRSAEGWDSSEKTEAEYAGYLFVTKDTRNVSVRTVRHLNDLRTFRAYWGQGNTFNQELDLNCTGTQTPIGSTSDPFTGTYRGVDPDTYTNDKRTIAGLNINASGSNCQGLFGVSAGTIKYITVFGTVKGNEIVGGLVGDSLKGGRVEYCDNYAAVSGEIDVGGLVGRNIGTVENCCNNGEIKGTRNEGTGNRGYGGVVGTNYAEVKACVNTNNVTAVSRLGGVVGYNYGLVDKCQNKGLLTADSSNESLSSDTGPWAFVGGIAGVNNGMEISTRPNGVEKGLVSECWNEGKIISYGRETGGIVGRVQGAGTVTKCYNAAEITARIRTDGKAVGSFGGVAGKLQSGSTVEVCYNAAKITATGEKVGGIVGESLGDDTEGKNNIIKHSYNTGMVTGSDYVGGILGGSFGTCDTYLQYCYNHGSCDLDGDPDSLNAYELIINVAATGTGASHYGSILGTCKAVVDSKMTTADMSNEFGGNGRLLGKDSSGYTYSTPDNSITTTHTGGSIAVTRIARAFYLAKHSGASNGSGYRLSSTLHSHGVTGLNEDPDASPWIWTGDGSLSKDNQTDCGRPVLKDVGEGRSAVDTTP